MPVVRMHHIRTPEWSSPLAISAPTHPSSAKRNTCRYRQISWYRDTGFPDDHRDRRVNQVYANPVVMTEQQRDIPAKVSRRDTTCASVTPRRIWEMQATVRERQRRLRFVLRVCPNNISQTAGFKQREHL